MGKECIVFECTNRDTDKSHGLSFHRIPKNVERRNMWLRAIKRKDVTTGKDWEPGDDGARVCSEHFLKGRSDDKDSPDYVPSRNLGYEKKSASLDRHERVLQRRQRKQSKTKQKLQEADAANALLELGSGQDPEPHAQEYHEHITGTETENDAASNPAHHDKCLQLLTEMKLEKKQLLKELERLQTENDKLSKSPSHLRATELDTDGNDERTLFFTGLPTHAVFLWMVNYVSSVLPSSNLLESADILLLTLMKLRLNVPGKDLAYRFGVSQSLISNLLQASIPALAKRLQFLVHWPKKEDILRSRPECFRTAYPKVVSIIDCTEVFIECPSNFNARAATYSNYKHTNTIKYLVSIVPCGAVSFVSRAFGGRASDKVITHRSGYLDFIDHGDVVMADRGFLIRDELASRGAELVMPSFLRGKQQFSAREVEVSRKIANVRIHVERAMERLKNFRVLSERMPMTMVPHADSIMTICAGIVNLHPNLVQ